MATYSEAREVIAVCMDLAMPGQDILGLNLPKQVFPAAQDFLGDFMQTESLRDLEDLKYSSISATIDRLNNRPLAARFSGMSDVGLQNYLKMAIRLTACLAPMFRHCESYTDAERLRAAKWHYAIDTMTRDSKRAANTVMAQTIPSRKSGPA